MEKEKETSAFQQNGFVSPERTDIWPISLHLLLLHQEIYEISEGT